ncbi:MAG: hypothetical protein AAGG79_06870 [Pseudomonadota bacterium]
MTGDLYISSSAAAPDAVRRPRLQAVLSSIVVTASAAAAALMAMAMLVVAFPLMLAASATVQAKDKRRGWTELEPVEA